MLDDLDGACRTVGVEGHRQFNPGWHLALDLRNMLAVCRCVALAALSAPSRRGGHTREDFPAMDPQWRGVNLICRSTTPARGRARAPAGARDPGQDLLELFERSELAKYLTDPSCPDSTRAGRRAA